MRWHGGYAAAAMALLVIEIGIALFVRDAVIRPHGGDVLAVMLVYCGLRAVTRLRVAVSAMIALGVAFLIEGAQAIGLTIRVGLAGNAAADTVLGTKFDVVDLAAYAIGAVLVMLVERLRQGRASRVAAIGLVATLGGCDDLCDNSIVSRVASPDGPKDAVLFQRDCGATTAFTSNVAVVPHDAAPDPGEAVFVADADHGLARRGAWGGPWTGIGWTATDRLTIRYARGTRIFRQEAQAGRVSVAYRAMPD